MDKFKLKTHALFVFILIAKFSHSRGKKMGKRAGRGRNRRREKRRKK